MIFSRKIANEKNFTSGCQPLTLQPANLICVGEPGTDSGILYDNY